MEVSSSLSTSDINSRISQIAMAGNIPEDWKDYIDQLRSKIDPNDESRLVRTIDKLYKHAFEVIPAYNNSVVRGQLIVDYANFRSVYVSLKEAEKILASSHKKYRQFATVHVAYAELELKKGNRDKAQEILQLAFKAGAHPLSVIIRAKERLADGHLDLSGSDDRDKSSNNLSPLSSQESSDEWSSNSFLSKSFGQNKETFELNHQRSQSNNRESKEQEIENIPPFENIPSYKLCQDLFSAPKDPKENLVERNPLTSSRLFTALPETPKCNAMLSMPESSRRRLHHYSQSTPNLLPSLDIAIKHTVSKPSINPVKLGLPRRVRVPPTIKTWNEEHISNTMELPSGSLFSHPAPTGKNNGHESTPEITNPCTAASTPDLTAPEPKSSTGLLSSHQSDPPMFRSPNFMSSLEFDSKMDSCSSKQASESYLLQPAILASLNPVVSNLKTKLTSDGVGGDGSEHSTLKSSTQINGSYQLSNNLSSNYSLSNSAAVSMETVKDKHESKPMMVPGLESNTYTKEKNNVDKSSMYSVQNASLANVSFALLPVAPVINQAKVKYVNGVPYTVLRQIGRGGSAKVYQIFDPVANNIRALKIVDLSSVDDMIREGYLNEIKLLKKLQHCDPVIKLFDFEFNKSEKKLYAVLEYGETDLDKFISQSKDKKKLNIFKIVHYWREMVEAVHAMHQEGVIHSDLKPANFLLVSGEVKLIDFGIANSIQNDCTSIIKEEKIGTPSYMSPESLMEINGMAQPKFKIGRKSDVWSLGCILYQMVYGHTPFQYLSMKEKLSSIVNPNYEIAFPDTGEPALTDVLKRCLTREVALRATTDEILHHPYISQQAGEKRLQNVEPAIRLLREKLAGISPSKQELSLKDLGTYLMSRIQEYKSQALLNE